MLPSSLRSRRATALMVVAVCLVAVPSAFHMSGRPVELSMFTYQPQDPIMTPMFMGYDAGEGAVRELARVAGPLQGAFSPASRDQLYSGYRGLIPMEQMEQPAYELVPVGDNLESRQLNADDAVPQLRLVSRTANQEPTAELPSSYSHAAKARTARGSVERLYAQLQDGIVKSQAEPFVREDHEAHELVTAVGKEASLHRLEPQLASEVRSANAKLHDDDDRLKEAQDDLHLYKKHVREAEHLGKENVKYLTAAQNYAQEAKREMVSAAAKDGHSMQVLKSADGILKAAHTAEVQARVNDNAAELTAAEQAIAREIARVRRAKAADETAAELRADAKENAFVSRVISKVRKSRFDNSKLGVKAMAEEGRDAEEAKTRDAAAIREDEHRRARAEALLERAKYQDEVRGAAAAGEKDAVGGLGALAAVAATERTAATQHTKWGRELAKARLEERAARQAEEKAAMLAQQ